MSEEVINPGGHTRPSEEGGFGDVKPRGAEIPQELAPYAAKTQQFIDRHRSFLDSIARRRVTYKPGMGFFLDVMTGEVHLDVWDQVWAEKNGLSQWQEVWSVVHELGHLEDLEQNPRGMLEHFEYLEGKAREIAPQVLSLWQQKTGGQLPDYITAQIPMGKGNRTMSFAEAFVYKSLHTLYNSLDDMYVNDRIGLRAAAFSGSQKGEVERLYRDYLFPTNPRHIGELPRELEAADYESIPKSYQLAYSVLRKHMVPGQNVLISNEVQEALSGYADEVARRVGRTLGDEIASITSPGTTYAEDPAWRYKRIRESVESKFVELFLKDVAEMDLPKNPQVIYQMKKEVGDKKSQAQQTIEQADQEIADAEKEGNEEKKQQAQAKKAKAEQDKNDAQQQEADAFDPWEGLDDKPEPIDLDTVREFVTQQETKGKMDQAEKAEKERRARLTPQERADESRRRTDEKICEKYGINPNFAKEYRELEKSIEPYKADMARVFEALMQNISQRISLLWAEGFRSGRFNAQRFIRKYGPLIAAEQPDMIPWEMLDVYDQREFMNRLVLFPDHIRTRLVLDGSGSMTDERLLALKQLSILFMEGLSTFEATVNLRFKLKDPIFTDTEIRMYGSAGASKNVKSFAHEKLAYDEELRDRFAALGQINNSYGQTCDAEPMWSIADSIDPEYEAALQAGKAKEFIFEVTDGGSNQPSSRFDDQAKKQLPEGVSAAEQDTRNALAAITNKKVAVRGLQVGEPSEDEKATFDHIWGEDGRHIEHPKDVAPAVAQMLSSELLKTQFQINYLGEDEL